jgi:hypothetical protein
VKGKVKFIAYRGLAVMLHMVRSRLLFLFPRIPIEFFSTFHTYFI